MAVIENAEARAAAASQALAEMSMQGDTETITGAIGNAIEQGVDPEFAAALLARMVVLSIGNAKQGTIFNPFEQEVQDQVAAEQGGGLGYCCKP